MGSRHLATAFALGIGLMLASINSAFALSSFSIDRESPVSVEPPDNQETVRVHGSLTCSSGELVTVSIQIIQQHDDENFDIAAGFIPKPLVCPDNNTLRWGVAAMCNRCATTSGLTDGPALAVATAIASGRKSAQAVSGRIAQTTSEIILKASK